MSYLVWEQPQQAENGTSTLNLMNRKKVNEDKDLNTFHVYNLKKMCPEESSKLLLCIHLKNNPDSALTDINILFHTFTMTMSALGHAH